MIWGKTTQLDLSVYIFNKVLQVQAQAPSKMLRLVLTWDKEYWYYELGLLFSTLLLLKPVRGDGC